MSWIRTTSLEEGERIVVMELVTGDQPDQLVEVLPTLRYQLCVSQDPVEPESHRRSLHRVSRLPSEALQQEQWSCVLPYLLSEVWRQDTVVAEQERQQRTVQPLTRAPCPLLQLQ